jgi:hypothetical protein
MAAVERTDCTGTPREKRLVFKGSKRVGTVYNVSIREAKMEIPDKGFNSN